MMWPSDMARRMEKIHEELCVLQDELYGFKYDCGGRASLDSEAMEVQNIMAVLRWHCVPSSLRTAWRRSPSKHLRMKKSKA